MARLKGRAVVVTGAGSGIGRAFARRIAREGARLALVDVDRARLAEASAECREAGTEVVDAALDVSEPAEVSARVDELADRLGGIDGLVNNAAVFRELRNKPFEDIGAEEFDRVIAVNARGPFLMCQAVVRHMRRRGGGKIVNMASGALLAAPTGLAHYVMSKGAIFAMTRVLARELGPDRINVNSIAPGLTLTDAVLELYSDSYIEGARAARSIVRDERPADLEGTLVYLLSEDSDFVTGQMIVVNGGAQFW